MRKIILSCLLLGISLTTYAQTSLFDLWQEASEHVNIYTYGLKKINKDTIYRPDNYRPNWKRKKGAKLEISSPTIGLLKKMLEDVESEGFQFNPQNDTLLFHVYFVVGGLHAILLLKRRQGYLITTSHQKKSRLRLILLCLLKTFL